jgi:hypothetical protein
VSDKRLLGKLGRNCVDMKRLGQIDSDGECRRTWQKAKNAGWTCAPCPLASARSPPASTSRRAVPRHDPRWEPGAVVPLAGICAGGDKQLSSLPRRSSAMSLDGCVRAPPIGTARLSYAFGVMRRLVAPGGFLDAGPEHVCRRARSLLHHRRRRTRA